MTATPPPWADGIFEAQAARAIADRRLAAAVAAARADGATWAQLGAVLGTSRQAAFQRFGGGVTPPASAASAPAAFDPAPPREPEPATSAPRTAPMALADADARAAALFELVAEERAEEAALGFSPELVAQLSPLALAAAWRQVTSIVGEYQGQGDPQLGVDGELTVVDIPLVFASGDMVGRVAFLPDGRAAGLTLVPPAV